MKKLEIVLMCVGAPMGVISGICSHNLAATLWAIAATIWAARCIRAESKLAEKP